MRLKRRRMENIKRGVRRKWRKATISEQREFGQRVVADFKVFIKSLTEEGIVSVFSI